MAVNELYPFDVMKYSIGCCGNFVATNGMPIIQGDKNVNFERTPQQDTLCFKKENGKLSKTSKTLIIAGTGLVALAGAFLGIRKLNIRTVSKIEKHFKKLYDNIPENQEKLKKVFMNDNLTEKETLEILKRYEQIEIRGLTQPKEEYFQAVFDEARKNFGFDDNIKLAFERIDKTWLGFWDGKGTVHIDPQKNGRGHGFNTIHHELRHAKQTEATLKYADMELAENTLKGALNWMEEKFPDVYKKLAQGRDVDTLVKDCSGDPEIWKLLDEFEGSFRNLGGFDNNKVFSPCTTAERANVTSEKIQFGRIMKKANKEHVLPEINRKAYFNNAMEVDARQAGEIMEELVGYHPFWDLIIESVRGWTNKLNR